MGGDSGESTENDDLTRARDDVDEMNDWKI